MAATAERQSRTPATFIVSTCTPDGDGRVGRA
jgi:hypothetical protein